LPSVAGTGTGGASTEPTTGVNTAAPGGAGLAVAEVDNDGDVAITVGGPGGAEGSFPLAHEATVKAATAQSAITEKRRCMR
jgi:hypothetical protein